MGSGARATSPTQFAAALQDLPVDSLYAKVVELQNSIAHLQRSNLELEDHAKSVGGDVDCDEVIGENEGVMGRMRERIEMVKQEIRRRGQKWHEAAVNGESDTEMTGREKGTTGKERQGQDEKTAVTGGEEATGGIHL
jgi:hypothetical protein